MRVPDASPNPTSTWECLNDMQVLVDISTPAEVFDRVDAAVGAHTSLHLGEFTGGRLVCARDAGEPLKYALCIFYEFCHNGERTSSRHKPQAVPLHASPSAPCELPRHPIVRDVHRSERDDIAYAAWFDAWQRSLHRNIVT